MAWKHIYGEYRVQHRETFRVWERLASFCFVILFSPHFSLFEVRHTKHTKGRLAHSQKHQKSPQHWYWWNMQWCFRHKQLSNTVRGIQNSMKENLWRSKRYGNCLRVSMAWTTRNLCSQIVKLLLSFTEWQKTLGREASENQYLERQWIMWSMQHI